MLYFCFSSPGHTHRSGNWPQVDGHETVSTAQFVEGKSKIEGYLSKFVGDVGGILEPLESVYSIYVFKMEIRNMSLLPHSCSKCEMTK